MKVYERALKDVHTVGGGETPPCVGLTSNTLPEARSIVSAESSQTGVSTRNAHIAVKPKEQKEEEIPHWYALRTTYGREKKAYDYMTARGITAFYPTIDMVKLINGKRKVVTESRLRQRKPPIPSFLLSTRPSWLQNREDSYDSS